MTIDELVDRADALEESGDLNEALDWWRAALSRESDPVILCRYGNVAMELGDIEEAERSFIAAIRLAPQLPMPYNLLGLLCIERGDLQLALDYFRKGLEIEESVRTLTFLGSVQLQLGMLSDARKNLSRALELNPDYEEAYYNLGLTFRHENPTEALSLFRRALELDPEYALAHRELGWVLLRLKRCDAEYHIRQAINLHSSDGWAHIYLGNLLWSKGNLLDAEQAFQTAINVWPDDSLPFWCLARFYEYQGRVQEADFLYQKALELEPYDPQANLQFGLFLKDLGEDKKARLHIDRALKYDPDNEYARAILSELDDADSTDLPMRVN